MVAHRVARRRSRTGINGLINSAVLVNDVFDVFRTQSFQSIVPSDHHALGEQMGQIALEVCYLAIAACCRDVAMDLNICSCPDVWTELGAIHLLQPVRESGEIGLRTADRRKPNSLCFEAQAQLEDLTQGNPAPDLSISNSKRTLQREIANKNTGSLPTDHETIGLKARHLPG